MSKLKFFIVLLILSNHHIAEAILFSLLKDLAIGVQALDSFNRANREILLSGLKNAVGNQNGALVRRNNGFQSDPNAPQDDRFSFAQIAGKIPQGILEIVEFLNNPAKFEKMGAKMPKGVLMYGPPGTGKTALARAIAGEANAKFIDAKGSEFVEIYVGVGPKRVRELFESARQAVDSGEYKAAVIFIDELDGIGTSRNSDTNSEYKNAIGALLVEMDGFNTNNSIMVLAATNMVESIDSALKRPGRFDRIVEVGLPDEESRLAVMKLYCQEINYDKSINLSKYVEPTRGWSQAELKTFINECAVQATRDPKADKVYEKHFDLALQAAQIQRKAARSDSLSSIPRTRIL